MSEQQQQQQVFLFLFLSNLHTNNKFSPRKKTASEKRKEKKSRRKWNIEIMDFFSPPRSSERKRAEVYDKM
jgi:UDP-2,3-diacylglucosamine pyrophosphatase LpxH